MTVTSNYSILTTTGIPILNSVEEHHNFNTEQLDVLLDGSKQSFSIATTTNSNKKLF